MTLRGAKFREFAPHFVFIFASGGEFPRQSPASRLTCQATGLFRWASGHLRPWTQAPCILNPQQVTGSVGSFGKALSGGCSFVVGRSLFVVSSALFSASAGMGNLARRVSN